MLAQKKYFTLLLLCLGYFIDFYDLTIMGVSYNELIKDKFFIYNQTKIQQTYLLISNYQTAGIFIGAIIFGILGDKLGRTSAIKYSILLYSIATLLAVFTHSLPIFILLRMIAYIGLATEFSTSTVLILETMPLKSAAWGTAILYSFGVLGGICATLIGFLSWKLMFIAGGVAGLVLFIGRTKLQESQVFTIAKKLHRNNLGKISELFSSRKNIYLIFIYFIMITPYFATISLMFIFPNYMIKTLIIGHAIKLLLIGFFIGNIISSLISAILIRHKLYFITISLCLFLTLMTIYRFVPENYILCYGIGLGFIGGGYPIIWAQISAMSFPVHVRSLASNILFALGRFSNIIFNIMISIWITNKQVFINRTLYLVTIMFVLAIFSVYHVSYVNRNDFYNK